MNSPIILGEIPGNHVQFDLESSERIKYIMEYSISLKLDFGNDLHIELREKIKHEYPDTNWEGIEYLSMVFLIEDQPTNIPDPILRLSSEDPDENQTQGNGLIVTMNPMMKIIHKPKRTTGKVSNGLGDS